MGMNAINAINCIKFNRKPKTEFMDKSSTNFSNCSQKGKILGNTCLYCVVQLNFWHEYSKT